MDSLELSQENINRISKHSMRQEGKVLEVNVNR